MGAFVAPGVFATNQYDAAALMMLAIEVAGRLDGRATRDALVNIRPGSGSSLVSALELSAGLQRIREGNQIDYEGASGPVDFNATGDVAGQYEVWHYVDGSFVQAVTISPSLLGDGCDMGASQ